MSLIRELQDSLFFVTMYCGQEHNARLHIERSILRKIFIKQQLCRNYFTVFEQRKQLSLYSYLFSGEQSWHHAQIWRGWSPRKCLHVCKPYVTSATLSIFGNTFRCSSNTHEYKEQSVIFNVHRKISSYCNWENIKFSKQLLWYKI